MTKNNNAAIYVIWWSDGEQDFEPVSAAGSEAEAAEYVYEREDDCNFYTVTLAQAIRPELEPTEEVEQ